jgi:mono/diheme cytochrome c family protein
MNGTRSMGRLAVTLLTLVGVSSSVLAALDPGAAKEGSSLYENYCATCHGEQLHNTSGGVTFDLRRLRPDEHERFVHSVLNGKNQMPPWRGVLDDNQIEDIWAYIRASVDP